MIAGLKSYLETRDATGPIIIASVIAAVITIVFRVSTASKLPTLNPKGAFEFSDRRVKVRFQRDASKLLRSWFAKNPSKPVVINGDMGPLTVLPPTMANEIRNDRRLGFVEVAQEVCMPASRSTCAMLIARQRLSTATFMALNPGLSTRVAISLSLLFARAWLCSLVSSYCAVVCLAKSLTMKE